MSTNTARRGRIRSVCLFTTALTLIAGSAVGRPTLIPEYDAQTELTRPIENLEDFRARLSVSIYEDPRLASPQRLREIIDSLDLRTPLGRKPTDLLIDPARGDFVGIDGGTLDLVGVMPDGSVIVSARDTGGNFVKAAKDRLVWARPDGTRVCFDLLEIGRTEAKMAFTLLLDRSGSMVNVMDEVLTTSRQFLSLLPGNARCTVASFAQGWTNLTPGGQTRCSAVRLPRTIQAAGKTDIYAPLSAFYEYYASPAYERWQKAVILITDGVITENEARAERIKARLVKQKGDVRTFVFWLGKHTEQHLAGLADYFIAGRGDVRATLEGVYGVIGEAYARQQVLKPKACTP